MELPLPKPLLHSEETEEKQKDISILQIKELVSIHKNQNLLRKPSAVIFDMSSTIISSHDLDIEAIDFILQRYGKPK